MKNVFLLVLTLLVFSCGEKKNDKPQEFNGYSLTIEAIYNKNDKIQVYFMTGGAFSEENSVITNVYASSEIQSFKILLPKNITPENLRIDISSNKFQNNITIKNISVYKSNRLIGFGDNGEFTKYFIPNEYLSYDTDELFFKINNSLDIYDPFFLGNDALIKALKIN
jgi:hypothetical protein